MIPYTLLLKRFQLWGLLHRTKKVNRTLKFDAVIIRVDAIGDYIIWRDSFKAYENHFHEKKVLLICADIVQPLAEQESLFSEIWSFNRKQILEDHSYLNSFLKKVTSISSDIVINPLWSRHPVGDVIVKSIQAPKKIGMVGNCSHDLLWKWYNRYYTRLIDNPDTTSELTAVEYYTQNVISSDYQYGNNSLDVSTGSCIICGKYIVVAISASDKYKVWPINNFVAVIDSLPSEYTIVLSGAGQDDVIRAEEIIRDVKINKHIINMINKTNLPQLVSLIGHASLVIGNDSAAVHIAAATRIPSVCILHGAHFGRFLPYPETHIPLQFNPKVVYYRMDCYGCGYHCVKRKSVAYECLNRVTVGMVCHEIGSVINICK